MWAKYAPHDSGAQLSSTNPGPNDTEESSACDEFLSDASREVTGTGLKVGTSSEGRTTVGFSFLTVLGGGTLVLTIGTPFSGLSYSSSSAVGFCSNALVKCLVEILRFSGK
jgi:hypothetical protein